MKMLRSLLALVAAAWLSLGAPLADGLSVVVAPPPAYHPGWISQLYYSLTPPGTGNGSTFQVTENRLYCIPIYAPASYTIDQVAVAVSTVGDVANQVRIGLYTNLNGRPNSLIVDSGRFNVGDNGVSVYTASVSARVYGWFWACMITNRNTGAGTMTTYQSWAIESRTYAGMVLGFSGANSTAAWTLGQNDQTVGTWSTYVLPTTAPTLTIAASAVPNLWVRSQ